MEGRCQKIASLVQHLHPTEQEELFKLLHSHRCPYTHNKHGIFVNLSWLPEGTIDKIENYIAFCHRSRHELQKYESLCDLLTARACEDAKQDASATVDVMLPSGLPMDDGGEEEQAPCNKGSSSLRFYLLKKKYAKLTPPLPVNKNDLKQEPYMYPVPTKNEPPA